MAQSGRRPALLAVHAHPDDETITTGGTLARYSAQGVRTIVVSCTAGDLGTLSDPGLLADGATVAGLRLGELARACQVLGVSRVVHLGYADSGMAGSPESQRPGAFAQADVDQAADRLVEIMRGEQPQVLISYDDTGGYGHPDHVKAHQVTRAAWDRLGADHPRKLYYVRFPKTWAHEFVRALRASGIDAPPSAATGADAGPQVSQIGVDDDLVTTVLDTSAYVAQKRAALACYRSQLPPEHFLMRMPPELARRLWAREFFSLVAISPATQHLRAAPETDLFAGLD